METNAVAVPDLQFGLKIRRGWAPWALHLDLPL